MKKKIFLIITAMIVAITGTIPASTFCTVQTIAAESTDLQYGDNLDCIPSVGDEWICTAHGDQQNQNTSGPFLFQIDTAPDEVRYLKKQNVCLNPVTEGKRAPVGTGTMTFKVTDVSLTENKFRGTVAYKPDDSQESVCTGTWHGSYSVFDVMKEPYELAAENATWFTKSWKRRYGIRLTWLSAVDFDDTFNVYYKDGKNWKLLKSGVKILWKGSTIKSTRWDCEFIDKTIKANTKRTYAVQRVHTVKGKVYKSQYGHNTATVRQVSAPFIKKSVENKKGQTILKWKVNPKQKKYAVYRLIEKYKYVNGEKTCVWYSGWKRIGTTKKLQYNVGKHKWPGAKYDAISYTYCVTAIRGKTESDMSNYHSFQYGR